MPRKLKVNILVVLAKLRAGEHSAAIARELGVSRQRISKLLLKLRLEGRIERTSAYPIKFKVLEPEERAKLTPTEQYGGVALKRVFSPHNLGEIWVVKEGDFRAATSGWKSRRFGKNSLEVRKSRVKGFRLLGYMGKLPKLTVWVKTFKGLEPKGMVVEARTRLRTWVTEFAKAHGLKLEFLKYAGGGAVEWATVEPKGEFGEVLIDGLALREGAKLVGDTVFKANDSSHKGRVEVMSASPLERPKAATDVAQRLVLLTRDDLVVSLPTKLEKVEVAVKAIADAVKALSDVVVPVDAIKPVRPEERGEVQ